MRGLLAVEAAGAAASSGSASMLNSTVDWWRDVNDSPLWQDRIFHLLTVLDGLVSAVALVQLIRIEYRVPEYGWTTQKVFHFLNFLVNGDNSMVGFVVETSSSYGHLVKDVLCRCTTICSSRVSSLWGKVIPDVAAFPCRIERKA